MKPNNTPLYVHKDSNHPPQITRNIPKSINQRLSKISSNDTTFNSAKAPYQEALMKSGYSHQLEYQQIQPSTSTPASKRKRKRNIIWFNPPFNKSVKSNIGKAFIKIIDEEFTKEHILHKIFNRQNIKISYSCMTNIQGIIRKHNKAIISKAEAITNNRKCNCRDASNCPMPGECLTPSIIYQATITPANGNKEETYVGLTETTFKTRYNNHKTTFNNRGKRTSTELSNYIWELKDNNIGFRIKWKILMRINAYNGGNSKCGLCIAEKFYIIFQPHMSTLNERRELVTTCRHINKHLLKNIKS